MFCNNCGKTISLNIKFCPYCGVKQVLYLNNNFASRQQFHKMNANHYKVNMVGVIYLYYQGHLIIIHGNKESTNGHTRNLSPQLKRDFDVDSGYKYLYLTK